MPWAFNQVYRALKPRWQLFLADIDQVLIATIASLTLAKAMDGRVSVSRRSANELTNDRLRVSLRGVERRSSRSLKTDDCIAGSGNDQTENC